MEKSIGEGKKPYLAELSSRVELFLGEPVSLVEPLIGGTNNLLHKIVLRDGRTYVAKQYFQDKRQRLEHEYGVLSVLAERGFDEVPMPVARFDDLYAGVYSFAEGVRIGSSAFGEQELEAIVTYLTKIQSVSPSEVKRDLLRAESSAYSLAEIVDLILERVRPFQEESSTPLNIGTSKFIAETDVISTVEKLLTRARERFSSRLAHVIPSEYLRLTSVDSGPHNMVWDSHKKLTVLDFEYAGWDHPLREIGNLLAHSQMRGASKEWREQFIKRYLDRSALPHEVTCDLEGFQMLSEIEWVMVNMSCLLPVKIARLQHAKGPDYDVGAHLERFMQEIRERLAVLVNMYLP